MAEPDLLLSSQSLSFVEDRYAAFLVDPEAVPPDWRAYFERLGSAPAALGPSFRPHSLFNPPDGDGLPAPAALAVQQDRVDQLVRAYRERGHQAARIDPLGPPRPEPPELDPASYGFSAADLDRRFSCETLHREGPLPLREIVERLRSTYCRSIGVEFMHIDDPAARRWLLERMERSENRLALGRAEQLRILTRLTDAVIFEEFLRRKFVGAKSFSLEGGESLIPLLDLAIEKAGDDGVDEIVLAMAHRGRLNVLANIVGKHPRDIFREFEDADPHLHTGRGDVKYHLGHSTDWITAGGRKVHLSLAFNPSHLGFVNPVAMGRIRAKQDRVGDAERVRGMALLIHGDACFAGEGITQETLNLSQLEGYAVGGALNVIVNNQIGFTTPPSEGRSSRYATDVTRMLQIPIFHVNGEDPEAVAQVVRLAMDFRRAFRRDVMIDMYCYRRLGHNEGDEPSFTQPVLYRAIEKRKPVREGYLEHLLKLGGVTQKEADRIAVERRESLEKELAEAQSESYRRPTEGLLNIWTGYRGGPEREVEESDTAVDRARLAALLAGLAQRPQVFHAHPKIEKLLEARQEMAQGKRPLDWSAGEALAFATLVTEGLRVRLTGQDSARGTFSHRHAVLHDYENGRTYMPLSHLSADQAPIEIWNSPLSEAGVLGFEYGYSLDCPDGLVAWEAQFGDFWNCAQVIVDQFVSSAEDKWRRLSALVMLLPHGFEGQGPEHSSARLERFLNLAAEENIQVAQPTTPAQIFHLLRRQVVRPWRKPLVVMTPKSLLRHPQAVSALDELASGSFQRLMRDTAIERPEAVERVLLCSGKVFYDLAQRRAELGRKDVAIVRVEQLYPLPAELLKSVLAPFPGGTSVLWVQEEPQNMGAWTHLHERFGGRLFERWPFFCRSRPPSASPATGSGKSHQREQEWLIAQAFAEA